MCYENKIRIPGRPRDLERVKIQDPAALDPDAALCVDRNVISVHSVLLSLSSQTGACKTLLFTEII